IQKKIEYRASSIKNAEDGADDLKTRIDELAKSLEGPEKEYEDGDKSLLNQLGDAELHDEAVALENEVTVRQKDIENVERAFTSLSYQEGHTEILKKKFDRLKVKGLVGELTKVKNNSTMTAVEVCAGGKLFNIVVDNENTAQQIIEKRDLRGRVTTIPLNRIKSKPVQPQVQKAAVELVGEGNAEVALSLVGYADEVKNAMEFVFGETFVCKTNAAAEKVAFDRRVNTRSVTLEGDLFQPGGLMTGGSI
ncbi:structural maintenance of chromosomes protein 2, partial [Tanacetum coccineum]